MNIKHEGKDTTEGTKQRHIQSRGGEEEVADVRAVRTGPFFLQGLREAAGPLGDVAAPLGGAALSAGTFCNEGNVLCSPTWGSQTFEMWLAYLSY